VSEGQYIKIWGYIDEAKDLGYKFLYGGERSLVTIESGNVARIEVVTLFFFALLCFILFCIGFVFVFYFYFCFHSLYFFSTFYCLDIF
jgi:hypothetical protein